MEQQELHPEPGDLYVHLGADGGIFAAPADALFESAWVTLEALRRRVAATPADSQIFLSHPQESIRSAGPARVVDEGPAHVTPAAPLPQTQRRAGTNALMAAAFVGAGELVRDLIERGSPVDERDDTGATALMLAAQAGENGSVETLHQAGADIEAADADGTTPLMFAAWSGNEVTVARLLELGADPARTRPTPLDPSRRPVDARGLALDGDHRSVVALLTAARTTDRRGERGGEDTGREPGAGEGDRWRPDPAPVVFTGPRMRWLYVVVGILALGLTVGPALTGTGRDVLIGSGAAVVLSALVVLVVTRTGAARLEFRGWTVTHRPVTGRTRTFDARDVAEIRRRVLKEGLVYRIRLRATDGSLGARFAVSVGLYRDDQAGHELLSRVAASPSVEADPATREDIAVWRRHSSES